jgi:hypothetical protein
MDELKAFIENEIKVAENAGAFFEFAQGYAAGCETILKHVETMEKEKAEKSKVMPNFGFDGQF